MIFHHSTQSLNSSQGAEKGYLTNLSLSPEIENLKNGNTTLSEHSALFPSKRYFSLMCVYIQWIIFVNLLFSSIITLILYIITILFISFRMTIFHMLHHFQRSRYTIVFLTLLLAF